jgi:alkyl hydroperoxide reductase subunit AhpF
VAVIVASGAESRKINVPGEEDFAGKGVSYCSLCDGPIFKGKVVAVVGGGNNGFESALFLSNYVKKAYILEYSGKVNADAENQELVSKEKHIEVITNAKVVKIEGKVFVSSITYQDLVSGKENTLDVGGVFVEVGYIPSTHFLGDLAELNEKHEIVFDAKTLQTKTLGLFSAGDCNVSKYKQIVMASGQGAVAALSAYEYIKRNKREKIESRK